MLSSILHALSSCSVKIRPHGIEATGLVGVLAVTIIVLAVLLH
jgi:hypothetical protein